MVHQVKILALLALAIASAPALATNETGPANTVLRVPNAGGRAVMGAVNLSATAATTGQLPSSRGGTGVDNSAATGVQKYASGTGSVSTVNNADITNSTIDLTAKVTGTLPVLNGGTGVTTKTGTGSVVLSASPTITGTLTTAAQTVGGNVTFSSTSTQGIVGTATNDNAATGNVGEYPLVGGGSGTPSNLPATTTWADLASTIPLTAGDWEVTGVVDFALSGATCTLVEAGLSSSAGNSSTGLVYGSNQLGTLCPTSATDTNVVIPAYRVSLTTPTTIFLKYRAAYTGGPMTARGRISERRVR